MDTNYGTGEARSLLGKLLEGDWVSQLFALALFVDLCLVLMWQLPMSQLTANQAGVIPLGQAVLVLLGFVLFSRWLAPALRHALQTLFYNRLVSARTHDDGVTATELRVHALRTKNSVAYQESMRHQECTRQQRAVEETHWMFGLVMLANMGVGIFQPTLANQLWHAVQPEGFWFGALRLVIAFTLCIVLGRWWVSLLIQGDAKISGIPIDLVRGNPRRDADAASPEQGP